jgi:hypothetical protein
MRCVCSVFFIIEWEKRLVCHGSYQLSVISGQLKRDLVEPESSLTDNRQLKTDNHSTDNYIDIIALLKPQFEAGKAHVKKGGIVSDKQVHIQTIDNLSTFVTEKLGATVRGLTHSPVHKDIGNIEYLLWLTVDGEHMDSCQLQQTTVEVVETAHESFEE